MPAPRPGPARGLLVGGLLAVLLAGLLVVGGAGASYAVDGDACADVDAVDTPGEEDVTAFAEEGSPVEVLRIAAAQQRVRELTGRPAGAGVTVAVLDSGVRAQDGLEVERGTPTPGATATGELVWHQGTLLAGVVAADPEPASGVPVGVAPGATIHDQRVYDTGAEDADGLTPPTSEALAAGLEAIAPLVGRRGIRVVTVGVRVPDSARLRRAVERVTGRGAIVVAASGGRADAAEGSPAATFADGEDLADAAFPAGYAAAAGDRPADPLVVSVATTASSGQTGVDETELEELILLSSAIDVAVPTGGAVSLGLNDRFCSVRRPSNAVAAAEVAGVLALLMSAYPDETAQQVLARLETTATGPSTLDPATPDTRVGKGVVQPLEALGRPLAPAEDGTLPLSSLPEQTATPAELPVPEPDVLASTREDAVWWGLLGGGVLVVLALVRPVLTRRR
jgi:membrane-anchored mycosin MYCP